MYCVFCGEQLVHGGRFCAHCGRNQGLEHDVSLEQAQNETASSAIASQEHLIEQYFHAGHTYKAIVDLLNAEHDICVSLRTVKSRLSSLGLFRREYSQSEDVRRAVVRELQGPGQLFGYRTMWQVLKNKYRVNAKRSDVMRLLAEINPSGTEARRRKRFARRTYHSLGPNYLWHADGYDKLKPFGFAISGCIDGFSRKIMWLSCGPTNNNPAVIAKNFMDCVKSVGVVPQRLRTDCGTENGTMAAIQCTLRAEHTDYHSGSRSHMYGTSVNNQRIEAWWSSFRKGR